MAGLFHEPKRVGFTGTQRGMTEIQLAMFVTILAATSPDQLHHGDCVGADAQAHDAADAMGVRTVKHPPVNASKQANKAADETRPPRPYLVRNRNIVDETDALIAAPGEMEEKLRSGTWSTIRYAKRRGKRVTIVRPDGSVSEDRS